MNVYQYTALKNPQGSFELLTSNGIRAHQNPKVMAKQLAQMVRSGRESAIRQLADIHPDLSLFQGILDGYKEKYKKECLSKRDSEYANANGQAIKSEMANLQGEVKQDTNSPNDKSKDLLIMGGIIVLGLALILKK